MRVRSRFTTSHTPLTLRRLVCFYFSRNSFVLLRQNSRDTGAGGTGGGGRGDPRLLPRLLPPPPPPAPPLLPAKVHEAGEAVRRGRWLSRALTARHARQLAAARVGYKGARVAWRRRHSLVVLAARLRLYAWSRTRSGAQQTGLVKIDLLTGAPRRRIKSQPTTAVAHPYLNTAPVCARIDRHGRQHGSRVQTSGFPPVGARGVAARGVAACCCLALALLWGPPGALLESKPMNGLLKPCGAPSSMGTRMT